jgi:hypothetical protein
MAKTVVFNCGNLNANGVCHAICGSWIRKNKLATRHGAPEGVTDVNDIGTAGFLGMIWDAPPTFEGIDRINLLGLPIKDPYEYSPAGIGNISLQTIARELTLGWNRYSMLSVWGAGGEGHSMATRLVQGHIQFLDPNFSCWEYDRSSELYGDVAAHIGQYYPDLLNSTVRVAQYWA